MECSRGGMATQWRDFESGFPRSVAVSGVMEAEWGRGRRGRRNRYQLPLLWRWIVSHDLGTGLGCLNFC